MTDIAEKIVADRLALAPFESFASIVDVSAAAEVQDRVTEALAAQKGGVAGYKIAWNNPMLLERFKLSEPGFGKVFTDEVWQSGAQLSHADYAEFLVEPEIVAEIGPDITPGRVHTPETVVSHVARYLPAFELLDRRGGTDALHAPSILAGNVFNAGAVLGTGGIEPDADLSPMETVVTQNGNEILRGQATYPQHPSEALAYIANHFTARGVALERGQFVLCGSHTPLLPVSGLSELSLSIAGMGEVSFRIG